MDNNYRSRHKYWRWFKKRFQTVMGSWCEDVSETSKMGEKQDDEEMWEIEGGYSLERGVSRHSIDFHKGKLGENSSDKSEREDEEDGEYTDGDNERSPQMFDEPTVGSCKTDRNDVLASPTKNTRKRKSTIPAVDKAAMATRGKRGNK